jgi:PhnB protein
MAVQGVPQHSAGMLLTLYVEDAAVAAAFYRDAFGAEEIARYLVPRHPSGVGPVKSVHLRIGATVLLVATANPRTPETMTKWGACTPRALQGFSSVVALDVDDVDAALARALAAGARQIHPPEDTLWGDRVAVIEDPFGHPWGLRRATEEITVEEHNRRWASLAKRPEEAPRLGLPG